MNPRLIISAFLLILPFASIRAQNSGTISGQGTERNVVATAVPFLTISPDPVSAAMGEVGVATDPDANAAFFNAAKLAFINSDAGFGFRSPRGYPNL